MEIGPIGGAGAAAQAANLTKPADEQREPKVKEEQEKVQPVSEDDRVGSNVNTTA
jgi:hypothetical protein